MSPHLWPRAGQARAGGWSRCARAASARSTCPALGQRSTAVPRIGPARIPLPGESPATDARLLPSNVEARRLGGRHRRRTLSTMILDILRTQAILDTLGTVLDRLGCTRACGHAACGVPNRAVTASAAPARRGNRFVGRLPARFPPRRAAARHGAAVPRARKGRRRSEAIRLPGPATRADSGSNHHGRFKFGRAAADSCQ